MQRTKVEKYIYSVIQKAADGNFKNLGEIESVKQIKSKKEASETLAASGYPVDAQLVLTDTETACYEMEDEFFFANAKKVNKTENEK